MPASYKLRKRPEAMLNKPKKLADCHNILDLREASRRRLAGAHFQNLDGSAETESTAYEISKHSTTKNWSLSAG